MSLPSALQRLASYLPWAVGRRQPPTLTEEKAAVFGHLPKAYTQTQEPNMKQLDITPKPLKLVRRA